MSIFGLAESQNGSAERHARRPGENPVLNIRSCHAVLDNIDIFIRPFANISVENINQPHAFSLPLQRGNDNILKLIVLLSTYYLLKLNLTQSCHKTFTVR